MVELSAHSSSFVVLSRDTISIFESVTLDFQETSHINCWNTNTQHHLHGEEYHRRNYLRPHKRKGNVFHRCPVIRFRRRSTSCLGSCPRWGRGDRVHLVLVLPEGRICPVPCPAQRDTLTQRSGPGGGGGVRMGYPDQVKDCRVRPSTGRGGGTGVSVR